MIKIKMLFLVFKIDGLLKENVPRKNDYLQMKKILDSLGNKILESRIEYSEALSINEWNDAGSNIIS